MKDATKIPAPGSIPCYDDPEWPRLYTNFDGPSLWDQTVIDMATAAIAAGTDFGTRSEWEKETKQNARVLLESLGYHIPEDTDEYQGAEKENLHRWRNLTGHTNTQAETNQGVHLQFRGPRFKTWRFFQNTRGKTPRDPCVRKAARGEDKDSHS